MLTKSKQFLGKRSPVRTGLMLLGIAAVFVLGMLAGNGTLHVAPRGQYKSQTNLPATINYASLQGVYDSLRQNYNGKLSETQVLDGLKHGLAESTGDPYTEFFTAAEATSFSSQLQGTFSGIGAQLEQDADKNIVVVAPLEGSPAAEAGLRAQDTIVSIDGKSTAGMTANDAVTKIRGKKGSPVTISVVRAKTQPLDFKIIRGDIQVPTATSKILDNNIGYLQVSQFSDDTFGLVQRAVTSFQKAGVKSVILDLRDDPGGEVKTAQQIASLWLAPNALIMQEKRGTSVIDSYRAIGSDPLKGMPTVVLINGGSASASEITALALHDNKAATIIGEKSYGKGVVQQVIPFGDGSALKVTVAAWYPPSDKSINKRGIVPDKTVTPTDDDYATKNDVQLQAAQDFLTTTQ